MKICFHDKSVEGVKLTNTDFIDLLRENHTITETCDETYDLIFNMSAFDYERAEELKTKYSNVPIVNYVWDFYKWAWDGKHGFDWKGYAEFLKKSDLIIVPSSTQQLRLKELTGLDSVVVKTGHRMFEAEVSDERFVLDHMRFYPEENERWVITAGETQYIPVIHPEKSLSREEIEKAIARCTFLACGYREASTGGLAALEGLWLGKPVLLSNSPYQGGKDYVGEFGTYFQYDDYNDLKKRMKEMFENPPKIDVEKARKYITENFTYEVMAKNLEVEFMKVLSKGGKK